MGQTLLFELGTEELPASELKGLMAELSSHFEQQLKEHHLNYQQVHTYATPRRLALMVTDLATQQTDQNIIKEGPFVGQAFDQQGQPTPAAIGFAKSCGVTVDQLEQFKHSKGLRLRYKATQPGHDTVEIVGSLLENAVKQLPIKKTMRWAEGTYEFVRPVHWVVLLLGQQVIDHTFFGCQSGQMTFGHRVHAPEPITLTTADIYPEILQNQGYVVPDWSERKAMIQAQAEALAHSNETIILNDAIVEEVTALVEWPTAIRCQFNSDFLKVPQEALISAMESHQKCFGIIDQSQQKLTNAFIAVSNIVSQQPSLVIKGNEKVMSARLSDANFFYQQDQRQPLEGFLEALKSVTFQQQLGSVYQRCVRIAHIAEHIADHIGANAQQAKRAGYLSKADLMTEMVFEFSHLQGIMGGYYAKLSGEAKPVCQAIQQQYWPKQSGGRLPETPVAQCVALAEKMDTLVGIFGIKQAPTGNKDPFALRRAAIGVLRILKETPLSLSLTSLIDTVTKQYGDRIAFPRYDLMTFFAERLRQLYKEAGVKSEIFASVYANGLDNVADFDQRIQAVLMFLQHPAAQNLIQMNKRVSNLLNKYDQPIDDAVIHADLFKQPAETQLYQTMTEAIGKVKQFVNQVDYASALQYLASLQPTVDDFFQNVMVMAEDDSIRANRLALLALVANCFEQIANIAYLA